MALTRQERPPQDDGLPAWILPVCLVISAMACFVMLRFIIGVLDDEPARPTPVTARPAP